ncbi:MAG: class I SAM-dependent methyltransferase [Anaerolineae bacterium]|nr:class I SAM-dependent methyltransferase [Anaerolineae bacterium]
MALEALWQLYQTAGYEGVRAAPRADALDHFYLALLAYGEDDFVQAAASARAAARLEPSSSLFEQAAHYLERVRAQGKAAVYVDGEAFAAFIRGGGNVELYARASQALHDVYEEYESLTLLDIGVGDGLALLPALTQNITRLDLIEPSEAMLAHTTRQLDVWQVPYRAHQMTIQQFMKGDSATWDVIQATWSLQSAPPADRPGVFAWLRAHGRRALIAEFDVPEFDALYEPGRVQQFASRYHDGLAEYAGDGGLVAQGFLMPVLFGYFDRSAARTNYEGPIDAWADGLRAAGFDQIEARPIYPYWWADAYLIDAR